ncbi:MAG: hypothetical protein KC438_00685 [Thermomicrobiales bacterium]|nr:hypothetical protein [Thermomicrobiales bacterium]
MNHIRCACSALVAGTLLLGSGTAGAQSPVPDLDLSVPGADQCEVAPLSRDDLAAVSEDASTVSSPVIPLETPNTEAATPTPFVAPEGTAVSGEAAANVESIAVQYYACQNANDLLRTLALFTDRYLDQIVGQGDIEPEALATIGTPVPARLESEQLAIAVNGMIEIEPGMYGVDIVGLDHATNEEFTDYLIVIDQDGELRIDEVLRLST